MKNLNVLCKILIIIFFINNNVLANTTKSYNVSYLSFDFMTSNTPMPHSYGGNIFHKKTLGINLAFGQMFNEYFGIELGGSFFQNKAKTSTTYFPELINGIEIDVLDVYELNKTTIKRKNYYLGLGSKLFINNHNFINLLVGAALVKTKATTLLVETDFEKDLFILRNYNKNKICPTFKIGLENKVTDNLSLTASAWWINSQQKIPAQESSSRTAIKIKNITNIAMGIKYYL